jgi:hypothetical protein
MANCTKADLVRHLRISLLISISFFCSSPAYAMPGDIDSDGMVGTTDRDALFSHLRRETTLTGEALANADANEDGQVDVADLVFIARMVAPVSAPSVDPVDGPTNALDFLVTGTAEPGAGIEVVGGASTVTGTAAADGSFSISVTLNPNQLNRLFVTVMESGIPESAPTPLLVTHDAQAPSVFIDFPEDGAALTSDSIDVAGRVSDMLSGFMGLDVTVNGVAGAVAVGIGTNGTYERGSVPLEMGANTLTVVATDILGNEATTDITVNRVGLEGPQLASFLGNGQEAEVDTMLPLPVGVRATLENGSPLANKLLTFTVTRSNGRLYTNDKTDEGRLMQQVRTDSTGVASVLWATGSDAGCGNNRVRVSGEGIQSPVFFCATANPGPGSQINIGSGNNQRVEVGSPAPEPLRAWLNDSCNGVKDIPITFTVISGGGLVNGATSAVVNSGATGHAAVDFIPGPLTMNNVIEADFEGNPGLPATFVIRGLERAPSSPTRFSGLVLSNGGQPIQGAEVELDIRGEIFETTSDTLGQFTLTDIPSGAAHLHVDGLVATAIAGESIPVGSFPALAYEPGIIPNTENSLPMPVLLPSLNPANARSYDNSEDITLTVEEIDGLEMHIQAGSMTLADGTVPSAANPTVLALNQVHDDDVPMPMPDGAAPPFA